eukprot:UN10010
MCWNDHGGDAFFSHSLDGACSCQSANTDANSNSGTTSGRACMQPCAYVDSGDGHCVHVATSASLFDDATCECASRTRSTAQLHPLHPPFARFVRSRRVQLEATCNLPAST